MSNQHHVPIADGGNPAFGRQDCEECGSDLDVIPYTLGTVECPDCGHANLVAT